MTKLVDRKCVPCEGGVPPLDGAAAGELMAELHGDWALQSDPDAIETLSFGYFL